MPQVYSLCNCQQIITILKNCDDTETKIPKLNLSNCKDLRGTDTKQKQQNSQIWQHVKVKGKREGMF